MTRPTATILIRIVLGLLVVGGLGVFLAMPVSAESKHDYPLPRQSLIAGVDVGGLTAQEAAQRLSGDWATLAKEPWLLEVNGTELSVKPADLGLAPDTARIVTELESKQTPPRTPIDHLRRYLHPEPALHVDLPLMVNQTEFDRWVRTIRPTVQVAARDAKIDVISRVITPEQVGQSFDKGVWQGLIDDPLTDLIPRRVTLPVTVVRPTVTKASLGNLDFTQVFATYTTEFDVKKASRSHNIATAVGKWQGVVLPPHGTLSFNQLVGKRTAANGFQIAPVYENRRHSMGYGGGCCQVSTTLYNTALIAGLDILERSPHSRPCSYAPPGRDATVDYGSHDLKIRNPFDFALYIHGEVSGGAVTFTMFGDPSQIPSIQIEEAVSGVPGPGPAKMIIDKSLPMGTRKYDDRGFQGRKVTVTRIWNPGTPQERREIISTDRTSSLSAIILYNPAPTEAAGAPPAAETVVEPEPSGDNDNPDPHF